jgi:hypothetical protein
MLFSRFAKSAAALLLLTVEFAAPVHAQSNKPITSGTWYEDRAISNGSTGTTSLNLTYAQTPSDKFLNITNVSCHFSAIPNQPIIAVTLNSGTTSGNNDVNRPYSLEGSGITITTSTTLFYSILTNQVFYKIGRGRYPSIEIQTTTNGSLGGNCTIVGTLTDD